MRSAQLTIQEVRGFFRRRRKFFVLPTALVTILCICGAFVLPRKYESSTTILVQRDEILNPLVSFTMAVSMAREDRLQTFNEIVYSQLSIQMLIDSLKLDAGTKIEAARQELIKAISKNILTERPGTATFRITYLDGEPLRAQRGVTLLADYFIKSILQVENQRNELAVQFFEKKLEELREKFETQQKEIVSLLRTRIEEMPIENRTLWGNMEDVDRDIGETDSRVKEYQRGLSLLQQISYKLSTEKNKQILFELQRSDLPHAAELRPLVVRYDEYTRRYTSKYPEVRKLEDQIQDLLLVMRKATEAEIAKQRKSRWEFEQQRSQLVEEIKHSTAAQEIDKDKKSTFDIIRNLYDEMKVKLEQARTNRDLGRKAGEQFVIIDPPLLPTEPTKPNRALIIGGGISLGLLLGIFSAALAELLDPTIRGVQDVHVYRKRVIAFIPETTIEKTL